ncbi:MAG TPA: CHASE2 domain-containing protein, partial [Candidatus Marinimicrobia bacterium]|nr:CHASE2 domain-containing protein [Candidatus Neomarinimicrobiota bacterium]
EFVDIDECEKTGEVCHNGECVEYKECHDINQNGKWDAGLDVVIVENDDESFRLIPEPYPYPRGSVWYRVIKNLTDAGAKVIIIDYIFDKPDHPTKNLVNYKINNGLDFPIIDGDEKLVEAVEYAESQGTKVIFGSKIAYEASRLPNPFYHLPPTDKIINNEKVIIYDGLVDIPTDSDNFHRSYWPFVQVDTTQYLSLGVEAVLFYKGIDGKKPIIDRDENTVTFNSTDGSKSFTIDYYPDRSKGFLINFLGPPSNSFNTFSRFPITNILDTQDYTLTSDQDYFDTEFGEMMYVEDQNWMENIIGPMAPFFASQGFINPFKGKIVVIGSSLAEEQDFKPTPYLNYKGKEYQFPGVEYHANAIQHMIDGNYIQSPLGPLEYHQGSNKWHLIIIATLIIVTLVFVSKAPPLWGFVVMAIEVVAWASYAIGSFLTDQLWLYKLIAGQELNMPGMGESAMIPILFPVSAIVLPFGINLTYKLFTEGQDKAFLKSSFGSYISPELIDQMYESKSAPSLGGEEGYNTAFFSDIASFSTFSEKLTASELVELLNEYLNEMTNILLGNKGTLDKYIGDAIIAFYGAPVETEDHEYLACLTCCQMNDKLEELRQKWKSEGDKWPVVVHNMRHRIGVNCGSLVTGNMGSDMRMNYTMMGDTVNLTARLESGAKQYGIETQVGSKIYEATKDRFTYRMLDYAVVKGRSEPERTFELISEKGKEPEVYKELIPVWDKAIEHYTNQDWDDAIKIFKKCDKLEEEYIGRPTTPCKVYINRCEEFKENSPGKDWNGAFKLTSK